MGRVILEEIDKTIPGNVEGNGIIDGLALFKIETKNEASPKILEKICLDEALI